MAKALTTLLKRAMACISPLVLLVPAAFALVEFIVEMIWLPFIRQALVLFVLCFYGGYWITVVRGWSLGSSDLGSNAELAASGFQGARWVLVLLPAGMLAGWLQDVEPWMIQAAILAGLLCWLPASLLVLARSGSVLVAVNPGDIGKVMTAMGADYVRVWLLATAVLFMGMSIEQAWADAGPGDGTRLVVWYLRFLSGLLVAALLAAATYGRREQLGLGEAANDDLSRVGEQPVESESEFIRRARQIVRDDGGAAASAWLEAELDRLYAPPEVHDFALALAIDNRLTETIKDRGRRLITSSLDQGEADRALKAAASCVAAIPEFALHDLETDDRLIELAMARARTDLTLALCRNFVAHFPRYRRSVDHGITAAKLLIDRYGDPAEARRMLADAVARGAEGDQLEAIRVLMKDLSIE